MKKLIFSLCLLAAASSQAVDYGELYNSVDKQKAADSVDKGKMMEAVSTDGVDYEKAYDSVDKAKAVDSIDKAKAAEALTK